MKTFLVTGGAGFIGSHLCEALLLKCGKVIVVDSFNDFYLPTIKRRNINDIREIMRAGNIPESYLEVIEGDIRDTDFINSIFEKYKINIVIHLAAYAGVRPSIENPQLYYDVNVMGTLSVLEAMKKNNIRKLIFASSSSIYGNNGKVPFSETDFVDNPISPYAASKKTGELICYTYSKLYDMKIACLRFFTVYGPRQRPDLAIFKFTKAIFNDLAIPFYGNGETKRDYTFIGDIIHGIIQTLDWIENSQERYDVFNLGNNNTVSLMEMVQTLETQIGKNAILKIMPLQMGDMMITNADITKSQKNLNYNPKTSFAVGINHFIKWYLEKENGN